MTLKIMALNTCGFISKTTEVINATKSHNIACLIEMRWPDDEDKMEELKEKFKRETNKELYISKSVNRNTIVIAYDNDIKDCVSGFTDLIPGRCVRFKLSYGNHYEYHVYAIHAPNASDDKETILDFFTRVQNDALNNS